MCRADHCIAHCRSRGCCAVSSIGAAPRRFARETRLSPRTARCSRFRATCARHGACLSRCANPAKNALRAARYWSSKSRGGLERVPFFNRSVKVTELPSDSLSETIAASRVLPRAYHSRQAPIRVAAWRRRLRTMCDLLRVVRRFFCTRVLLSKPDRPPGSDFPAAPLPFADSSNVYRI